MTYAQAIDRYVNSLNETGLRQALAFCLLDKKSHEAVINCAIEFDKAFPKLPETKGSNYL